MAVPSAFVSWKTTVGFLPTAASVTLTMVAVMPFSCFEFSLMRCAPLMDTPNSSPSGLWQEAQALSLACAPAGWLAPVAQLMSSWQEPHASRLGFVYQT